MTAVPRVALTLTQTAHRVPGGTASSVLGLATALADTGEVDLTAVLARGELRHPGTLLRPPAPPGLRSLTLPLPVPLLYDAWSRWGRPTIDGAGVPFDLVHVTVPMRVGLGGLPMVATVHDLFPLTRPEDFTARGARLMRDGLDWVLRHARAVMVPSETVAAACSAHGLHDAAIIVVPWGAPPTTADAGSAERARARHGLVGPYVLFVGTVEPRKNLAGLIEAMALLGRPDVTLVVVGPTGWGPSLDGAIAGLPSPVARLGHVPAEDLPGLYAGASAFCFPSLEEGFGLPVLEAMSAGAPVVTSSGTATADVAGDAALLVDPLDRPALADALARVLDDRATSERLRAAGRARAAQHRWDDAARRTLDVYRSAIG